MASVLRAVDPSVAADVLLSVPPDTQQRLFRSLPAKPAAKIAGVLPYYDAYVLLHSRPLTLYDSSAAAEAEKEES